MEILMHHARAAAILLLLAGCQAPAPQVETKAEKPSPIERGEYLVSVLACGDCHTPLKMGPNGPEPDLTKLFSGHPEGMTMPPLPALPEPWLWAGAATNTAYSGPWGVSFATNLTPEEVTGLGIWTEEMFLKALKTGKHMGTSRTIMPPMPWPAYSKLTDEDLKAIYAYLRSIPPIRNQPPDYQEPSK
jgi:mono/diheme cytochrome c family protein